MGVSYFLRGALCAGALALVSHALAEESAGSTENGQRLFEEKCAACHTGVTAPTPDVLGTFNRGDFQGKLESHTAVGGFEDLTQQDKDDIYAFLKTQVNN